MSYKAWVRSVAAFMGPPRSICEKDMHTPQVHRYAVARNRNPPIASVLVLQTVGLISYSIPWPQQVISKRSLLLRSSVAVRTCAISGRIGPNRSVTDGHVPEGSPPILGGVPIVAQR